MSIPNPGDYGSYELMGTKKGRGYQQTANKDIPLNDRPKGEIAPVAWGQLLPYQEAADQWPMHYTDHAYEYEHEGEMRRAPRSRRGMECRLCGQFIYLLTDEDSHPFQYSDEEKKTLVVAHIRRQHAEKVIINDKGHCEILDLPADNDFGGSYHSLSTGLGY